jgi:tetratricopeptide (TPR) repeat protein
MNKEKTLRITWLIVSFFILFLFGCGGKEHPKPWRKTFADGNAEFLRGNYTNAIRYFRDSEVMANVPGEAYNNIALCYLALGQYAEAYKALAEAVGHGAQPEAGILMNKAILERAFGDTEQAIRTLREAMNKTKNPNLKAQIAYNLGWLYESSGDLKQAKAMFEDALQQSWMDKRTRDKATVALGVVLAKQGDTQSAMELFRNIANDPRATSEAKEVAIYNLEALSK